eukprot:TRINITY_DN21915_c0_g1_i1.p1 TRINITY_DN21915_c0_g1~~TRINITY_DN21915_c0_g1_i1.p1  ORF type:complete len:2258 (+),score=564.72 TRINITY_DN21915_c0_g1_i1:57-6830(+)
MRCALATALAAAGADAAVASRAVGVELPGFVFNKHGWDKPTGVVETTGVFNDLMAHCSTWVAVRHDGSGQDRKLEHNAEWTVGADGFPAGVSGNVAAVCVIGTGCADPTSCASQWAADAPDVPGGTYTLSFTGTGTMHVSSPPGGDWQSAGQVTVQANKPLAVWITASDQASPITGASLSTGAQQQFRSSFLQSLSGVKVLRVDKWLYPDKQCTEDRDFAARTAAAGYGGSQVAGPSGVSLESVAALATSLGADVWTCAPTAASGRAYAKDVATTLRGLLPSGSTLYVQPCCPMDPGHSNNRDAIAGVVEGAKEAGAKAVGAFNHVWVAGTVRWLGASGLRMFDSVALVGYFGHGVGKTPGELDRMGVNDDGGWSWPGGLQVDDVDGAVRAVRDLQLSAVVETWRNMQMIQGVLSEAGYPAPHWMQWGGGPVMRSRRWMYRGGESILRHCVNAGNWPCSVGNTRTIVSDGATYNSSAFREALAVNQSAEQRFEDVLAEAAVHGDVRSMLVEYVNTWFEMAGHDAVWVGLPVIEPALSFGDDAQWKVRGVGLSGTAPWAPAGSSDPRWLGFRNVVAGSAAPALTVAVASVPSSLACPASQCSNMGTCWDGQCHCYAGRTGADCSQVSAIPSHCGDPMMGLNPTGLADWGTANLYWDMMKQGREWIPQDWTTLLWETGVPISLRDDGYPASLLPNQKAGSMLNRDVQMHGRSGWYVMTWEGDGIVDASLTSVERVRRISPWRAEVKVQLTTDFNNGVFIEIHRTNPANPVRNIRFIPKEWERIATHANPFQPHVLQMYSQFSVIRYKDLFGVDSAYGLDVGEYLTWNMRTQLTDRSYRNKTGIPYEDAVKLSNMVGAHLWVSVPHSADDAYVRQLAALLHSTLRSDLRIYVEFSNEAWANADASYYGGLHTGGIWAAQMGAKMTPPISHYCYVSLRTRQYKAIFDGVIGGTASQRVKYIISPQAGYSDTGRVMLGSTAARWIDACAGESAEAYKWVDVVAIAPYAGAGDESLFTRFGSAGGDTSWVTRAITEAVAVSVDRAANMSAEFRSIVDEANTKREGTDIELWQYEGGLHFGYPHADDIPVNFHPTVESVVRSYYDKQYAAARFELMMQFGSYGAPGGNWNRGGDPFTILNSPFIEPSEAPKFRAVAGYMRQRSEACASLFSQFDGEQGACVGDQPCGAGRCYSHTSWAGGGVCNCAVGAQGRLCETYRPRETFHCGYKCGELAHPIITRNFSLNGQTLVENAPKGTCAALPVGGRVFASGGWQTSTRTHVLHTCSCMPPFYGRDCSLSDCPDMCNWRGRCQHPGVHVPTVNPASFQCDCHRGFSGARCEVDCGCKGDDGLVHGTCDGSGGCRPDWGWRSRASGEGLVWSCTCDTCSAPGECGCSPACVKGTCFRGRCLCWQGASGEDCSAAAPQWKSNGNEFYGVNVGGVAYYTVNWPFVDIWPQMSSWTSVYNSAIVLDYTWGNGQPVSVLRNGLPRQILRNQTLISLGNRDTLYRSPDGNYTVLWDGDVDMRISMDAQEVHREYGRAVADFRGSCAGRNSGNWNQAKEDEACEIMRQGTSRNRYVGDNGFSLSMSRVGPRPLRSLSVVMPGFEHRFRQLPLHPRYLKDLERYSCLRMHPWTDLSVPGAVRTGQTWAMANARQLTAADWRLRRRPGDHPLHRDSTVEHAGVPWERIVHTANVLDATPWINIPPSATDDWVTALAELFQRELRDDRKVIMEYGNEMWNPLFEGAEWCSEQGLAASLGGGDRQTARYQYYARRSVELCKLWRGVLGSRGSCVLAGWMTQDHANEAILGAASEAAGSELPTLFDEGFAIAAYYDCGLGSDGAMAVTFSPSEMADRCEETARVDAYAKMLTDSKAVADKYGLPLSTYEAGPHISESAAIHSGTATAGLTAKFHALARSERMYNIYGTYMEAARGVGIKRWMQFVDVGKFSQYGSFGLKEWTGQYPDPPKHRRLLAAVDADSPLPMGGCPNDVTLAYGLGLGTGHYAGPPHVMSPQHGDRFTPGGDVPVVWDTATLNGQVATRVSLHRAPAAPACGDADGFVAQNVAPGQRRAVLRAPSDDGARVYARVQLEDGAALYSDIFTIAAAVQLPTGAGPAVIVTKIVASAEARQQLGALSGVDLPGGVQATVDSGSVAVSPSSDEGSLRVELTLRTSWTAISGQLEQAKVSLRRTIAENLGVDVSQVQGVTIVGPSGRRQRALQSDSVRVTFTICNTAAGCSSTPITTSAASAGAAALPGILVAAAAHLLL